MRKSGYRVSKKPALLPKNVLTGIRLGMSVSESPDLPRLGLLESHFRLALAEIARCVLVSGGHLAYGGHLRPDGYTAFLVHELERYGRRDRPLRVCLAWSEHRSLDLSVLGVQARNLGLLGEIVCLDLDGTVIDPAVGRNETAMTIDADATRNGLTGLRRYMARHTSGRLLIGGKRHDFQGEMPGLLEEAILAVQQGQPIYLAGGFGGITLDIARALGVADGDWLPDLPNPREPDDRTTRGLSLLAVAMATSKGQSLLNGLSIDENSRLVACYRPSEIAALVSLGLGRKFEGKF